jgi:Fe-S-cluster containining protein
MVAGCQENKRLVREVAEIYSWIDRQLASHSDLAGRCEACGRCCDFESFDHRLYLTPPELMYLAASPGLEKLRPMTTSRCPYNIGSKCTVYEYRFAGCRIFCCKADADFQSRLSEEALKKIKSLCTKFQIPYSYKDLKTALDIYPIRK